MAGAPFTKIFATLGSAVLLALGACSQDAGPTTPGTPVIKKTAPQTKRGPSVDELTTGMVQAAPLGRSSLRLDLKFDLGQKPVKGQPLELNLALVPLDAGNQTTVTLNALQGFDTPETMHFEMDHLDVGSVYRHTLQLTPNSDGVLLVGLTVSVNHDETTDSKQFSIPVIVGP